MTNFGCGQFRDVAPDLALGLLAGNERGDALNHLATCASCRRHLDGLVQVADYLVLLAPSVEPEIGFESRVVARLAADGAFTPAATSPAVAPSPAATRPAAAASPIVATSPAVAPSPAVSSSPTSPIPAAPIPAGPTTAGPTAAGSTTVSPIPTASAITGPVPADPIPPDPVPADAAGPIPAHAAVDGLVLDGPVPHGPGSAAVSPIDTSWSGSGARSRRRWARPVTLAVAAALVVVLGVTGVVAGFDRARSDGRASALRVEAQTARRLATQAVVVWADGGKSTCQLVAFAPRGAQPARLVIHLDEPNAPPDSYQVYAVPAGTRPAFFLGTVTVSNGQGTLTASLPTSSGPVDAVRVMEGPENTKYWATFAAV
jgi:hypothetical protein